MREARANEGHILPLDGLRGVAVLLVFVFHAIGVEIPKASGAVGAVAAFARWGYSGVDLFFVLSGFLITRILLRTRSSPEFYKNFYMRRVLRVFPLYYLAVVLAFFVLPRIAASHLSRGLYARPVPFSTQIWFWLNISNFRTAFYPMLVPLLTQLWSLAIEEQFYLFWPGSVRRMSEKTLGWICFSGFFLPLVLRVSGFPNFGFHDFYYRITPFHVEGLFAGAGLALIEWKRELFRLRAVYIAAVIVSAAGILACAFFPNQAVLNQAAVTFFSAGSFGLIGLALLGKTGSLHLATIFSWAPLRMFGDCSYFIYIFDSWFALWVKGALAPLYSRSFLAAHAHIPVFIDAGFTLAAVLGAALISRRIFEGPILGLKRYFRYHTEAPREVELIVMTPALVPDH